MNIKLTQVTTGPTFVMSTLWVDDKPYCSLKHTPQTLLGVRIADYHLYPNIKTPPSREMLKAVGWDAVTVEVDTNSSPEMHNLVEWLQGKELFKRVVYIPGEVQPHTGILHQSEMTLAQTVKLCEYIKVKSKAKEIAHVTLKLLEEDKMTASARFVGGEVVAAAMYEVIELGVVQTISSRHFNPVNDVCLAIPKDETARVANKLGFLGVERYVAKGVQPVISYGKIINTSSIYTIPDTETI